MHEPDTKCYEGILIENCKKFVESSKERTQEYQRKRKRTTKKAWLISLTIVSSQKCERLN